MTLELLKTILPPQTPESRSGNTIIFTIPKSSLRDVVERFKIGGASLRFLTAIDHRPSKKTHTLHYLFSLPEDPFFLLLSVSLEGTLAFPSVSDIFFMANAYESRILDLFGLTATGNAHLKHPLLHETYPTDATPLNKEFRTFPKENLRRKPYTFQEVRGEGIYEVSVGPIHAGIIEPGHFRFSVAGEEIMLLEPRLGYVHKGTEKLFENLELKDKIKLSEKISGDSSFSHSLAFCQALETLAEITVPERDQYLRVIFAELERIANHLGDIGAIMLDTGFSFGGSHGARLRERVMRLNEALTESRFLRGVNTIGGVTRDFDDAQKTLLHETLRDMEKDFSEVIAAAENSASLLNRLKGTGILTHKNAERCTIEGLAGRASGLIGDLRFDVPYAAYGKLPLGEKSVEENGDVYARFLVRIKEVRNSFRLIQEAQKYLAQTSPLNTKEQHPHFAKNALAVGYAEGWRGPVFFLVATDEHGNLIRVAPRDVSIVNWHALGLAGPENIIPDFPLINKSFNLSYSGNDL